MRLRATRGLTQNLAPTMLNSGELARLQLKAQNRRTNGMNSEEELLGFLSDLVGQWGSRRRKRRIVDAADFGDVLPLDWKLLLSLKRKYGRAWIYCRKYIRCHFKFLATRRKLCTFLLGIIIQVQ